MNMRKLGTPFRYHFHWSTAVVVILLGLYAVYVIV
ncbi:hypothetical protein LMIY3S_03143 [Labrys miyagiensis]